MGEDATRFRGSEVPRFRSSGSEARVRGSWFEASGFWLLKFYLPPRDAARRLVDRPLAWKNRARAWQEASAGEVTHPAKNAEEDHELQHIGRARLRQHFPKEPKDRLRDTDGPHRPVEIPPLATFALRRRLDAR